MEAKKLCWKFRGRPGGNFQTVDRLLGPLPGLPGGPPLTSFREAVTGRYDCSVAPRDDPDDETDETNRTKRPDRRDF